MKFILSYIIFLSLFFTVNAQSPGGVGGFELWLKADSDVYKNNEGTNSSEDGEPVLNWSDQAGNSDATRDGNNGTRPTWNQNRINFNPSIYFTDDGNRHLNTSTNPASRDMTLIGVFSTFQSSTAGSFWGAPAILGGETGSVTDDYALALSNGSPLMKADDGNGWGVVSPGDFSDGTPHILIGTREKANSGPVNLFVDGLLDGTGTSDNSTLNGPNGIGIGNHNSENGPGQFEGEIPEVIAYRSVLSATNRLKVESYMAIKYGFTLGTTSSTVDYIASDGTTLWTGNATYQNDVAGIGRDDDSALEQKQSMSGSTDAIVTMGLTSIATDNASNGNSFSSDIDFLTWGNDDGNLFSNNTSDIAGAIEARMIRVWRVQKTGNVGSTKIRFDMNVINGVTGAGDNDQNDVVLLVDGDGVFSSGATSILPTSINNTTNIIEFDHTFGAGTSFITLGSTDISIAPLPVTFTSFEVLPFLDENEIYWTTTNEVNNSHFEIERSFDNTNWHTIGEIEAATQSTSLNHYTFTDDAFADGVNYYRIKQVDIDGTASYTIIKSVGTKNNGNNDFYFYPNPTHNEVFASLNSDLPFSIEVFNQAGTLVLKQSYGKEELVQISLQEFSSGVYTFKISFANEVKYENVVKY